MTDVEERRDPDSARMRAAISEIVEERGYQAKRWGADHDKSHTPQDWTVILSVYLGKASSHAPPYTDRRDPRKDDEAFRKRLIQLAAICVAAIEALDGG